MLQVFDRVIKLSPLLTCAFGHPSCTWAATWFELVNQATWLCIDHVTCLVLSHITSYLQTRTPPLPSWLLIVTFPSSLNFINTFLASPLSGSLTSPNRLLVIFCNRFEKKHIRKLRAFLVWNWPNYSALYMTTFATSYLLQSWSLHVVGTHSPLNHIPWTTKTPSNLTSLPKLPEKIMSPN